MNTSISSGLAATFRLVEIGVQIQEVPVDAQTLVRLVQQVEEDLEHAVACRVEAAQLLRRYPDHYRKWIVDSIRRTMAVLDEFGQFVLRDTDLTSPSFEQRVSYLLRNYSLADREKPLKFAHDTLLAAINAMHLMLIQSGTLIDRQLSTSMSAVTSSPALCRASSQRPFSPQLAGMSITVPTVPPQELPSIWAAELEGQSMQNAQNGQ